MIKNICIFWLFFSGFYLTQITFLSPVYIYSFVIGCLFIFVLIKERKFYINYQGAILFFSIIFVSLYSINSSFSMVLNLALSLFSFIVTYSLILSCDGRFKEKNLTYVFILYAILFLSDAFVRIIHPDLTNIDKLDALGIGFQIYKSNSIMYADSNFVGLEAVFIMSCFIAFINSKSKNYKLVFILLVASIILTFSRAAYFGLSLILMFYFLKDRKILRYVIFYISPMLFILVVHIMLNEFSNDISFNSKFNIFYLVGNYLTNASLSDLVFGVGLGNAVSYIGMGTHILLLTFLVETGFLGLFGFVCFLLYLWCILKYDFTYIILPFLVVSFSLGTTAIPYFFAFSAFFVLYKKNRISIIR